MWTAVTLWILAVAIAWNYGTHAVHAYASGAPLWRLIVTLPAAYFAALFVFVAGYFAIAWWFRAERPVEARLSVRETLELFWREYTTMCGSAPRMMFDRLFVPDPPAAPAALPVLLLHGVLCNAGVWRRLARFLDGHGIAPVYTLSYGPPLASIEVFAMQTAAKIDAILAATGASDVVIVAHSMGGLVARAYLRRYGGAKVRRVVTIGTPHAGSVHAYLAVGASMAQLRPGNPWLVALPLPRPDSRPPIVSIWSWHDSMVAPQTSARLAGAENIALVGIGHNALIGDAEVFERVVVEIGNARN